MQTAVTKPRYLTPWNENGLWKGPIGAELLSCLVCLFYQYILILNLFSFFWFKLGVCYVSLVYFVYLCYIVCCRWLNRNSLSGFRVAIFPALKEVLNYT